MKCALTVIVACVELVVHRLLFGRRDPFHPGILCRFGNGNLGGLRHGYATIIEGEFDSQGSAVLGALQDQRFLASFADRGHARDFP